MVTPAHGQIALLGVGCAFLSIAACGDQLLDVSKRAPNDPHAMDASVAAGGRGGGAGVSLLGGGGAGGGGGGGGADPIHAACDLSTCPQLDAATSCCTQFAQCGYRLPEEGEASPCRPGVPQGSLADAGTVSPSGGGGGASAVSTLPGCGSSSPTAMPDAGKQVGVGGGPVSIPYFDAGSFASGPLSTPGKEFCCTPGLDACQTCMCQKCPDNVNQCSVDSQCTGSSSCTVRMGCTNPATCFVPGVCGSYSGPSWGVAGKLLTCRLQDCSKVCAGGT